MNKLKIVIITLVALIGVTLFAPSYVGATPASEVIKGVNDVGGNTGGGLGPQLIIVVNILLYLLGAIAVIMIVIGGIRYTTSNGDSSSTKGAKDTILYAVVGLIIAMLAYAIVNFVVKAF
ncbi:MAG TPA: hypothetical protein VK502_02280 [Candidatus Saccharimonadales bacterium]|nr:hypothetical protein [Candidatus Saccharimonadales bacterium]